MTYHAGMLNRRRILEIAGLTGIGAVGSFGVGAHRRSARADPGIHLGSRVIDLEDSNPDTAIVIKIPEIPIDEWWVDDEATVADHNPTYPIDDRVVIVGFENQLFDGWSEPSSDQLFRAVVDRKIKYYSFPVSRLRPVQL